MELGNTQHCLSKRLPEGSRAQISGYLHVNTMWHVASSHLFDAGDTEFLELTRETPLVYPGGFPGVHEGYPEWYPEAYPGGTPGGTLGVPGGVSVTWGVFVTPL